ESAAQDEVPQLGGLGVGEVPLAQLDSVKKRKVVDVVIVVQVHRLLDRARVDARQTADGAQKMAVGAGVILGPDGPAFLPIIDRETAEAEAALAGEGRIHQARERELGRALVIGGNRKIVVFDARILAERSLKRVEA